jgi:hypothetical protein
MLRAVLMNECDQSPTLGKNNPTSIFFIWQYLYFFSWQDSIIAGLAGKGSKNLAFELTTSSALGFGMQSLAILL